MGLNNVKVSLQNWLLANPTASMIAGNNTFEHWVVEQLLMYVNAILDYGSWMAAGLPAPQPAVMILASHYGVSIS